MEYNKKMTKHKKASLIYKLKLYVTLPVQTNHGRNTATEGNGI